MTKPVTYRWFLQARAAHEAGRLDEALPLYRRILRKEPANLPALYGAALLVWQLGDNETALRWMRQVVARKPEWADGHYNLAVVYETLGQFVQAIASYQEAITKRPTFGDAWEGLGKCLHALGDNESAVACFEKALAVRPPTGQLTAESRYNMSYSLLALGRWAEGWAAYEARFQSPVFMGNYVLRHPEPVWDGSPLEGRILLVHAEQGFGDSLMMARYIHQIEGDVVIEVQQPLVRLFMGSFPGRRVIAQGEDLPKVDCQVAMMSLAHRFGMSETNVPTASYLVPPGSPRLPAGDGLKVGIVWAGSRDHRKDKFRSIALEHWKPLWGVAGVTWYSLQVDEEPVAVTCHTLKPLVTDFADTAALVAQLDLVICCDTSVAHLAGALGKPVWTLLAAVPDYRWGLERPDTPFYPTMRLVRQPTAHDWASVFREVHAALEVLTMAKVA